jgi:tRNA uridine 5-carboxymethylaminomethyl modification enzyme
LTHATTLSAADAAPVLSAAGSRPVSVSIRIAELARRPEVPLQELCAAAGLLVEEELARWVDTELKYSGYVARERAAAGRLAKMDELPLPAELDYRSLTTLSTEAREKLDGTRPTSLGQASRIPGISPSDLQSLVVEIIKARRALAVSRISWARCSQLPAGHFPVGLV